MAKADDACQEAAALIEETLDWYSDSEYILGIREQVAQNQLFIFALQGGL